MKLFKTFEEFKLQQPIEIKKPKKDELSDTLIDKKGKLQKKVIHIKNWNQY
jgi:hypothetical protein